MKNFTFFLVFLLTALLSFATMAQVPEAGLKLWLRSDAGVDTLNGTVSNWHDQSGNGNDVIQTNASRQPLLVANALNGKPVLRFDGWDDKLGFTSSTPMSQFTLFMVVKNDSGGGLHSDHVLNFGSGGNWNNWYFILFGGLERIPDRIAIGGPAGDILASAPSIATEGEWRIISIVTNQTIFNTTLRWNGSNATMIPGGTDLAIFVSMGDSTGSGGGIAGANNVPNTNLLTAKCDFAEAIVYDTLLTQSEILAVENYLADKYNITIVTGIEDPQEEIIPEQFTLSQNYPNPFNPSTTIKFQIPNSSFVNLKIYDILGREVATLVNEEKPAGSYEVDFDASKLASEVYLYKLNAGNLFETKKMILLR